MIDAKKPNLSTYTDYRDYLRDYFLFRRELSINDLRPYSYSDFSAAANIKSPSYLKMIIEGQRNLSPEMCKKFSQALKHDKQQGEEFLALVSYCQEKDPLTRNKYLKQLSELRARQALEHGEIDESTWEKVPSWLSWVLYSMIDQQGAKFDPQHLKKLLRNTASEQQIRTAIDKLLENKDIFIDEHGYASKQHAMISNANKVAPALIRKLQSELIYLALESLYKDPPTQREISGFTLAMTEEEYNWARLELRKIRKEIQSKIMMAREKTKGQRVYQVNLQMFPLTLAVEEKSSESTSTGEIDI